MRSRLLCCIARLVCTKRKSNELRANKYVLRKKIKLSIFVRVLQERRNELSTSECIIRKNRNTLSTFYYVLKEKR